MNTTPAASASSPPLPRSRSLAACCPPSSRWRSRRWPARCWPRPRRSPSFVELPDRARRATAGHAE